MLTEFNCKIEHLSGERMKHVDGLSRAPIVATVTSQIQNSQMKDEILKAVINMMKEHGSHDVFIINRGVLPKGMRSEIIRRVHEDGH